MDKNNKPCLVLDLDETLIHAFQCKKEHIPTYVTMNNFFTIMPCIDNETYYVFFCRPYLKEFLLCVSEMYEIYVYTNATQQYCEFIIATIHAFINKDIVVKYVFREPEQLCGYKYLSKLNIDKSKTVIIDDRSDVWIDDGNNLINIKAYNGPYEYQYNNDDHLSVIASELTTLHMLHKTGNNFTDALAIIRDKYILYRDSFVPVSYDKQNTAFELENILEETLEKYLCNCSMNSKCNCGVRNDYCYL